MTITISAYDTADQAEMVRIWLEASRVGHPFLSEDDLQSQLVLVRDVYLPKAESWVAFFGSRPAGFIGLLGSFIGGLFVDPALHGAGVGGALVEHAAREKPTLSVDVYALNKAAIGFYQRLGFVERSRRMPDDKGRPLELIRMLRA